MFRQKGIPPETQKEEHFLKKNYEEIKAAIEKAFSGADYASDGLLTGSITNYRYVANNCADLTGFAEGEAVWEEDYGPGMQIEITIPSPTKPRHYFFYAESLCPTMSDFIDEVNTDFAFTQLINAEKYKSLEIIFWDMTKDLIYINHNGEPSEDYTVKMRDCYNIEARRLDIHTFLKQKEILLNSRLNQSYPFHFMVGKSKGIEEDRSKVFPEKEISFIGLDKETLLEQTQKYSMG